MYTINNKNGFVRIIIQLFYYISVKKESIYF